MLHDLYVSHRAKLSDKWAIYISTYERLLAANTAEPWRILEIGIQNGGSLEIWARYFPQATHVVGCDINPACAQLLFDDPRIFIVVGDANATESEDRIAVISPYFDCIIDDGSHVSRDIVSSFARYFKRLTDGGVYIAEDLHCSYWLDFDGGVLHPASSMAFFKRLADIVNHEHWGVASPRIHLLASFAREFSLSFDEAELAHIHSVEFVNSMCIVRKRAPGENLLGPRIVRGLLTPVTSAVGRLDGTTQAVPEQTGNRWSVLDPLPEDELQMLREHHREQCEQLARQEREHREHQDANQRSQQALRHELQQYRRAQEDQIQAVRHELAATSQRLLQAHQQLQTIVRSRTWRMTAPLRSLGRLDQRVSRVTRRLAAAKVDSGGTVPLVRKCLRVLAANGPGGVRRYLKQTERIAVRTADDPETTARKIFQEQQQEFTAAELGRHIENFASKPLISVAMPVYKTPVQWLIRAIESLREQHYEHWELCAVDDCSPTDEQRSVLQEYARRDPRVRFQEMPANVGISEASNASLKMAQGDYVALVDHDDELTPDAFFWIVKAINDEPDADFLYSDECKIDDTPERRLFHFIFKPKWSPELMFNGMVTGHLTVYKTALVRRLGGFRRAYDFSQDYDLALRAANQARRIVHIERVLYLWRAIPGSAAGGGKDFARDSNVAALADYLVRNGIEGTVSALPHANRVMVKIPDGVKVSIIIPSDSYENLTFAIQSILDKTTYPLYEVVAVCNSPLSLRLESEYAHLPHIIFSAYDSPYNFSDKCNQGARDASGEVLIFYNDDVFPIDHNWVMPLIEYLYVRGVGGVSPKLLYEDETIQYAGMIAGVPGMAGTAYHHVHRDGSDAFLSMHRYVRNVSVLSGACCAVRRAVFEQIGGFDAEHTPDGHSDLDLSFKLLEAGYRCVYTPYSVLFHIGHGSWTGRKAKYKADMFMLQRWGRYLSGDDCFTNSMKRVLYDDFRFTYHIFAAHLDPAKPAGRPDVLFVSHELSPTGAPRMLLNAAQGVLARGGFPVVVSPKDGPLRNEFVDAGIAVIVDESVTSDHFLFARFARNFDMAVVNTIALHNTVRQLQRIDDLKLTWWLHEAQALTPVLEHLNGINKDRVRLLCVSDYAKAYIPTGWRANVLHNGVVDERMTVSSPPSTGRFSFVISGTIEPRKGQDLFIEAVLLLPDELRRNCRFVLMGKIWDMHLPFWESLRVKARDVPQIEYLGLLDHEHALEQMAAADVVVCPSRDEPFSLAVIEAAMLGKPAIVSRQVGVSDMVELERAGLVFESEDVAALTAQLVFAIRNPDAVAEMGVRARQSYERGFTIQHFSEAFLRYLNSPP